MSEAKSSAQRAYEAWVAANAGPHSVRLVAWEQLSDRSKGVWASIARAARGETK